jgi:thiol:disulfide interchange protein DsbD
MLAWGVLLVIAAIYLRALDPLPPAAHGFQRFSKGMGVIALVAGTAYLIGAFAGGRDVLQPLSGLWPGQPAPAAPVAFKRVNNLAELEQEVRNASGKTVMLDFYADWCVSCKEMERFTFTDAQVQARLANMVKLQVDVTANTPDHAALLKRFRLFGPPGIVFFDREGREIPGLRVIGFQAAAKFAAVLDQALGFK